MQTRPDPDKRDHLGCDDCGLVVDALAALTWFRVELGHLCSGSSPGGLVTYWTHHLEEHVVATPGAAREVDVH